MNFLRGLARAFTVPRAIRAKINANPLVAAAIPTVVDKLQGTIDAHFGADHASADALNALLIQALQHTGVIPSPPR
jgi:hypothetical protein